MSKKSKRRRPGRPAEKPMPARIDATPKRIAQSVLRTAPPKEWNYLKGEPGG